MTDIEIPGPEAWDITPGDHNTLQHRTFHAEPKERLVVDYHTFERYLGRIINLVVPAEVVDADIRYYWKEKKNAWKETIQLRLFELNPKTLERYSLNNPKSAQIFTRDAGIPAEVAIREMLSKATKPTSTIQVKEIPRDDTRRVRRTKTHRYAAVAPDEQNPKYGTLLGFYTSEERAAEVVENLRNSEPFDFEDDR